MAHPPEPPKISLRHRLEYGLFRAADALLGEMPMHTVQALGELAGGLFYMVDARHRRVIRENLRFANLGLSEAEVRTMSKTCFRHYGALFIGLLRLRRATPEELLRWIRVEGLENYDVAQAEGKGFIQLTGHYGNWEIMGLGQSLQGRLVDAIGRELDNPMLEAVALAFRGRFGNRVIPKRGAMKGTLKALKAGRGVGFMLDQDAGARGIFVRFLGQWASTYPNAGNLAARLGLPILPAFAWPNEHGTWIVRFDPPFHVPSTGDLPKDEWVATQLMTACIEAQIRRDPRWWFWMHRRFKTRPGSLGPQQAGLPPEAWVESMTDLPS